MSERVDFLVEVEVEVAPWMLPPWLPWVLRMAADCAGRFRNVERALVVLRALTCRNSDMLDLILKTTQRSDQWNLAV